MSKLVVVVVVVGGGGGFRRNSGDDSTEEAAEEVEGGETEMTGGSKLEVVGAAPRSPSSSLAAERRPLSDAKEINGSVAWASIEAIL